MVDKGGKKETRDHSIANKVKQPPAASADRVRPQTFQVLPFKDMEILLQRRPSHLGVVCDLFDEDHSPARLQIVSQSGNGPLKKFSSHDLQNPDGKDEVEGMGKNRKVKTIV